MIERRQTACFLLKLPDNRFIFQRRTKDAPVSPGELGVFGGTIELGETIQCGAERELCEETSLSLAKLAIYHIGTYDIADNGSVEVISLFGAEVPDASFEVYEGEGVEIYSLNEVLVRDDVVETLRQALKKYAITLERKETDVSTNRP